MKTERYIDRAIAWAMAQQGREDYCFRCLAFVEDAYEEANAIEVFGGDTARESADQYGVTGDPAGEPPRGAFVFYDMTGELFDERANYGHVGLHIGNGLVVHAWDVVRVDHYAAVEKLETAEGWTQPRYLGWVPVERVLHGHRVL